MEKLDIFWIKFWGSGVGNLLVYMLFINIRIINKLKLNINLKYKKKIIIYCKNLVICTYN